MMSKEIHAFLRILLFVCMVFPHFLHGDINSYVSEEQLSRFSAEERACYENYLQIARGEAEPIFFKSGDIFFQREGHTSYPQDVEISLKAFNLLQSKAPSNIYFNYGKLIPFDHAGTCSAMALDFLARYQNTCAKIRDNKTKKAALKENFKKHYTSSSITFSSRQAAFNTIEVAANLQDYSHNDITTTEKMQAIANFHAFRLKAVSPLMDIEQIRSGHANVSKLIDELPKGCYIVRLIWPMHCEKMEWFGHTMVFAKDHDFATFFDNYRYCKNITGYAGEAILDEILKWGIQKVRIYRAEARPGGCINVAE